MTSCPGGGQVLSYAQLQGAWINNGGPAAVAPIAAAIALAESSGCTTALNPNDNNGTQSSFGLWQISTGTHTPPSANWSDPNVNAQLAVAKYKGAGNQFTPWGTYDSGAYKAHLNGSTTPDTTSIPASATLASASGDNTCAASWPSANLVVTNVGGGCIIHKATVRHIVGGALLAAGGLLAIPGIAVLVAFTFRASGAQKAVLDTAQKLGPGGRVLKAAGRGAATRTGATAAGRERRADRRGG